MVSVLVFLPQKLFKLLFQLLFCLRVTVCFHRLFFWATYFLWDVSQNMGRDGSNNLAGLLGGQLGKCHPAAPPSVWTSVWCISRESDIRFIKYINKLEKKIIQVSQIFLLKVAAQLQQIYWRRQGFTHWTSELAGGKVAAAAIFLCNTSGEQRGKLHRFNKGKRKPRD